MDRRMSQDLDRYITGNYGEKQMVLPSHTCVDRPQLPCDACGTVQHTPGPWTNNEDYDRDRTGQISTTVSFATNSPDDNPEFNFIAIAYGRDRANCEANARLIAAAPEMLEQLERNIQQLDAGCRHCWGDEHPADDADCSFCCSRKATEALVLKARGE